MLNKQLNYFIMSKLIMSKKQKTILLSSIDSTLLCPKVDTPTKSRLTQLATCIESNQFDFDNNWRMLNTYTIPFNRLMTESDSMFELMLPLRKQFNILTSFSMGNPHRRMSILHTVDMYR